MSDNLIVEFQQEIGWIIIKYISATFQTTIASEEVKEGDKPYDMTKPMSQMDCAVYFH